MCYFETKKKNQNSKRAKTANNEAKALLCAIVIVVSFVFCTGRMFFLPLFCYNFFYLFLLLFQCFCISSLIANDFSISNAMAKTVTTFCQLFAQRDNFFFFFHLISFRVCFPYECAHSFYFSFIYLLFIIVFIVVPLCFFYFVLDNAIFSLFVYVLSYVLQMG